LLKELFDPYLSLLMCDSDFLWVSGHHLNFFRLWSQRVCIHGASSRQQLVQALETDEPYLVLFTALHTYNTAFLSHVECSFFLG